MTWFRRLRHRRQLEEQLDKELLYHLDQHTADLMARGLSREEARRQARLALGGPEQVKERCRDARGTRWLEDLFQDVRYAVRTLRQRPGFAAVAFLTLALGIGATTVMFTVINGVLLKPRFAPDADRLLILLEHMQNQRQWAFAYLNFLDCQRQSRSLAPMMAWRYGGGTVSKPGTAEYVNGYQISSDLFKVLGTPLLKGRAFQPEEDRPGAPPVAIISYGLWQRRFAGNPAAVGMPIVFEGKPYSIVGIAPPGFTLQGPADIFTPLGQNSEPLMQNRDAHPGIQVMARLRPGFTLAEAQADLNLIAGHLAEQYPKSNKGRSFEVKVFVQALVAPVRSTLWLLLGAVSLVLLIACINVAGLLLARAVSRERELAMRVALGAGRGRLVRQCLTESLLLGIIGGTLGVFLAVAGIRPFVVFWPGGLPLANQVRLDPHVLLFALAASLASGLLLGVAPALRVPRCSLEQALRAGARNLAGTSRRLHRAYVAFEIALAVVLLVAAWMLGRALLRLSGIDPGLNVHNVMVAGMSLSPGVLTNPDRTRAAWQDVLDRARRVPGIESAALCDVVPMGEGNNMFGYWTTADRPLLSQMHLALATSATPDYLRVMGIRLREGRFFDAHDRVGSQPVVVIDEVMARSAFGSENAVGKLLWVQAAPAPMLVVGVVAHVRNWGLAGDDQGHVRDQLYYPFAQVPDPFLQFYSSVMAVVVRTSLPAASVFEPLRLELRGAAGDQALHEPVTLEQLARDSLGPQRFLMVLFGIFAGLALLLASIGIYGVLAYLTSRRVPEFGVRIALGATTCDVILLVLRESLLFIAIGIGLGLPGAWMAGRIVARLVVGTRPPELSTYAVMVSMLLLAALSAGFLPAYRASRVDPVDALRQE
jgi:predicted permease